MLISAVVIATIILVVTITPAQAPAEIAPCCSSVQVFEEDTHDVLL